MPASTKVLEVRDLSIEYIVDGDAIRAVDGVDLEISRGECVALVGESGSGKSTVAQAIIGVLPPNARVSSGEIIYMGRDLLKLGREELRRVRGREISIVFQDPLSYLNPLRTVRDLFMDVARDHGVDLGEDDLVDLLRRVRVTDPHRVLRSYPFQLSGGMAQRVAIAIALALKPKLLIADEPTTALDLTIQAQIIRLLLLIKEEMDLSILLITHDLGMIAPIADSVYVMYSGKIVEVGSTGDILASPRHPYTIDLIKSARGLYLSGEAVSELDRVVRSRASSRSSHGYSGKPPREGCRYIARCPYAFDKCSIEPNLIPVDGDDRSLARCWLYEGSGG